MKFINNSNCVIPGLTRYPVTNKECFQHSFFIKTFYVFLIFCFSSVTQAESWYQVEVVVFERLNPYLDGEQWQDEAFTSRSNLVELQATASNDDGLTPFMLLDKGRNRLNGVSRVFRLSSEYRPLLHYSWQQPALERRKARYVHIQKMDGEQGTAPVVKAEATDAEPEFLEEIVALDRIIDGSIRIRSGFYLHADIDLSYFKELPDGNKVIRTSEDSFSNTSAKTLIKLKETRKIKLNEIHYFDHPMFGVILQVSRL